MTTVEVTTHRDYDQPADRLWWVFADPETAAQLDDRVALVAVDGAPGSVGSSYELSVAYGPVRLRQHVEVAEAQRPALLRTVTSMEGQVVATQSATIEQRQTGCRVTWTLVITPSRLAAGRARKKAALEVERLLAAAEPVARNG